MVQLHDEFSLMPMNILHIAPSYYPATYWGGPIFSVYALNNALARLPDVSLTVLTTDAAGAQSGVRTDTTQLVGLYPNQEVIMTQRLAGGPMSLEPLRKVRGAVRRADWVYLTTTYSLTAIATLAIGS